MKRSFAVALVGALVLSAVVYAQLRTEKPARIDTQQARIESQVSRNKELGFVGEVSGRVLYEDGKPAAGILVIARFQMHQSGAPGEGDAFTREDGTFTIQTLGKNRFLVGPAAIDDYVGPKPVPVDLTTTPKANVGDFILRSGPEVTVRVKDAESGQPVPGLLVKSGPAGMLMERGTTDASGEAKFRANLLEFDLSVEDKNRNNGYGAPPGRSLYKQVRLESIQPVVWEVLVYKNYTQPVPASFKGIVVDEAGKPVRGADVKLQRYNDFLYKTTDAQGKFVFETQRIGMSDDPQKAAVLTVWLGPKKTVKILTMEETWGEIKVVLGSWKSATAVGRVVDRKGVPLSRCQITYWENMGIKVGSIGPSGTYYTQEDGTFELKNLHPGATYTFSFGTYYENNKRAGVTQLPAKGLYEMKAEGLDLGTVVVPRADHYVSGVIFDQKGRPVTKNVLIKIKGVNTDLSVFPDETGHFKAEGVVSEPLKLYVFVGKDGGYRTDPAGPDTLLHRAVQPDAKVHLTVKMRPPID